MQIIINWLNHEELRLIQTFIDSEKEKCKTSAGLFEVLSEKFKPQHNERILSLQYQKPIREEKKNAEE